jgi:O-antigen ligase
MSRTGVITRARMAPLARRARITVTGERLAVTSAAAAIVFAPVLQPILPGHSAPVDSLMALTVGAWLLWASFVREGQRLPYALPVAVLIVGGALGALAGPVPNAGLLALVQDLALLLWGAAIANLCRSATTLRLLLTTWVWSSIGWVCVLFAAVATHNNALAGVTAREGSRVALTFGDPNVAANYFFISIMLMWAIGRPRRRGLRVLVTGMLLLAIAMTGSNGGLLSVVIGAAATLVVGVARRYSVMPALGAACALVLLVFAASVSIHPDAIAEAAHNSNSQLLRNWIGRGTKSTSDRQMIIHESIPLLYRGGPLGQGPVSTKPRLQADQAPFVKEAHDDYLAALSERGVIGVLGLLLLLCSLASRTWTVVSAPLRPEVAEVVRFPPAVAGVLMGVLMEGLSYEVLHFRHVWALFGFLAALSLWGRR